MVGSDANLADRARSSFSSPSAFGELPSRAGSSSWFTNPSVVFPEPTSSRSRQQNSENVTEGEGSYVEDSEGLLFAEDASQYDSDDGDVSSQPLPPYVGMVFDTVDDARKFYNDYAFKLGYNIERQAAAYYTRTVFGKFQKQVTASTGFIVNQDTDYQGQGVVFELKATSYENPKLYSVHAVKDEGLFECSCHYFEMNGLICAHIIRAMVHLNVQAIPQQYLLERWSEAATTSMGRTGRLLDFGHPSTNTLKYNSLCRRLTWLASNACCNDDAYRILDDAIKALEPAIAAAKRGAMPDQQATQHSEPPTPPAATTVTVNGDMPQRERSDMLQNPARVPKKGRPTDREKRKKTLVEQRDDEQKKKMKQQGKKATTSDKTTAQKRTVRCKHCNELGHNIQTCGTLKAAMEAAAAPSKCQFCSGVGHAVPEYQYLRAVMANDQRVAQMTQLNL
ncbi:Protein FAR1-RELATED SEQUENCE 5 [Hordeum vulgare]|nr:Protein FAR1-RELATED SEQUENCE 5 [Hordeum vulgare]